MKTCDDCGQESDRAFTWYNSGNTWICSYCMSKPEGPKLK